MKTLFQNIPFLLLLLLVSCNDFFEKDITNTKVELLAPANELTTAETNNTFWWNYTDGALWYELQVVNPDFSNVSRLELDTIFEINNFQISLQPGVYHWRVRALNGSSSTEFTENSFTVIESVK